MSNIQAGHCVSENCIKADPDKISALKTWPIPRNIKSLRYVPSWDSLFTTGGLSKMMPEQ